jgi:VanZ family protein
MNLTVRILQRFMPLFFVLGLVVTTIAALLPSTLIPGDLQFWDKAQHVLAYTALTVTGVLAFPRQAKLVCLGLTIHGALIEVLQLTLTTTRSGEFVDWLADAIGIVIGIVAYVAFARSRRGDRQAFL